MANELLNNYKQFSIKLIIYFFLYLIKCILCGNLIICLTKYNHSNLTSKWVEFIKRVDSLLFTNSKPSPNNINGYDFLNEGDRRDKYGELTDEFFNGTSINKNSKYFSVLKDVLEYGSTNEVEFDVVIKHNIKKYNLIYFKLNPNYIYDYLQKTFKILELNNGNLLPSLFLHKFHILALEFNRGLFNLLYYIPEFLILFLSLYNITFGIIISLLSSITYFLSMICSIYFFFQSYTIIFNPINKSFFDSVKRVWDFFYTTFYEQYTDKSDEPMKGGGKFSSHNKGSHGIGGVKDISSLEGKLTGMSPWGVV